MQINSVYLGLIITTTFFSRSYTFFFRYLNSHFSQCILTLVLLNVCFIISTLIGISLPISFNPKQSRFLSCPLSTCFFHNLLNTVFYDV